MICLRGFWEKLLKKFLIQLNLKPVSFNNKTHKMLFSETKSILFKQYHVGLIINISVKLGYTSSLYLIDINVTTERGYYHPVYLNTLLI